MAEGGGGKGKVGKGRREEKSCAHTKTTVPATAESVW